MEGSQLSETLNGETHGRDKERKKERKKESGHGCFTFLGLEPKRARVLSDAEEGLRRERGAMWLRRRPEWKSDEEELIRKERSAERRAD